MRDTVVHTTPNWNMHVTTSLGFNLQLNESENLYIQNSVVQDDV